MNEIIIGSTVKLKTAERTAIVIDIKILLDGSKKYTVQYFNPNHINTYSDYVLDLVKQ